jgi:hypothetical protein
MRRDEIQGCNAFARCPGMRPQGLRLTTAAVKCLGEVSKPRHVCLSSLSAQTHQRLTWKRLNRQGQQGKE